MPASAPAPKGDGRAARTNPTVDLGPAVPAAPDQSVSLVWMRVAQFSVDLAIVATLSLASSLLMELLPKAPDGTYSDPILALLALLLVFATVGVINICYWIVWPARHRGQTPAMAWFGLRVVSTSGARATTTQLALRTVMLAADGLFLGLVAVVAMLSNPARQRLGDAVANTIVIRTDRAWRSARRRPELRAKGKQDGQR